MSKFHSLVVKEVRKETEDTVSVLFDVPDSLQSEFTFIQGQYLTLNTEIDGAEVRRSYSICSGPTDGELRVAIKKIEGGLFSTFANEVLQAGDRLEVMTPMGNFYTELNASNEKHYVAFVSGSGITPVLSIVKAVMASEPNSRFTLFYGNKTKNSIIFKETLEGIKNDYMNRFSLYHILSREVVESEVFSGRITPEKCEDFQGFALDFDKADEFFLCGPEAMIMSVSDYLKGRGIDQKKIHFELFTTAAAQSKSDVVLTEDEVLSNKDQSASQIELIIDGINYEFPLAEDGPTILDAAMAVGADVPYACKGAVCCTCKARVTEGKVKMDANYALEEDEIERGFVLSCQAHPITEKVVIDFDEL